MSAFDAAVVEEASVSIRNAILQVRLALPFQAEPARQVLGVATTSCIMASLSASGKSMATKIP